MKDYKDLIDTFCSTAKHLQCLDYKKEETIMNATLRLIAMLLGIANITAMDIIWNKTHQQSLDFSFPATEQKKFHGALMRIWSTLYWATTSSEHNLIFTKGIDIFLHQVLYLNTFSDLLLISYAKKLFDCGECVTQMKEDIEHFGTIVEQSHACCAALQKNIPHDSLRSACSILTFIKEKMDSSIHGNGSLIEPLL